MGRGRRPVRVGCCCAFRRGAATWGRPYGDGCVYQRGADLSTDDTDVTDGGWSAGGVRSELEAAARFGEGRPHGAAPTATGAWINVGRIYPPMTQLAPKAG